MKTTKNGEYLQVVCTCLEERLRALCTYPRYVKSIKGVGDECVLYFKINN